MHSSGAPNPPTHPGSGGHEDDYQLMERVAARDAGALGRLYDRHAAVLYGLCLRILRDTSLAEDALIDVFAELWSRADRYNPARGAPIAYLVTLTRSRALDRARTRGSQRAAPLETMAEAEGRAAGGPGPYEAAVFDERKTMIRGALDQIDPKYCEVMECAYYEGLSHSEIALKLSKPIGTVKTYLRRGLIQLRDLIRNSDDPGLGL